MKKSGLTLAIMICIILALCCSVTHAVINYFVQEDYLLEGGTDYFYFEQSGAEGGYHTSLTLSGSALISLGLHDYNGTQGTKNNGVTPSSYTLLVFAERGQAITADVESVTGIKHTVSEVVNQAVEQTLYIYENIPFETNPSVTLTGNGNINAVVVTHSEHNAFVDNFFQLKMLRDQEFHDLGEANKQGGADWKQVMSGTYAHTDEASGVVTSLTPVTFSSDYTIQYDSKDQPNDNLIVGSFAVGDSKLLFTDFRVSCKGVLLGGGNNVVFTVGEDGSYYSEVYGLKLTFNTSQSEFVMYNLPYTAIEEVKNVYFVSDLAITSDCSINFPAYINLLYANIVVSSSTIEPTRANLSLAHRYAGVFAIDTLGGKLTLDPTASEQTLSFAIDTPNAYVVTTYSNDVANVSGSGISLSYSGSLSDISSDGVTVVKSSELVDFSLSASQTLLDAMLNEAAEFALARVPNYVYGDILVADTFHNYPVQLSYSFTDRANASVSDVSPFGNVARGENGSERRVTVTAAYGSTLVTKTKDFEVVGVSAQANASALAKILSEAIDKGSTTAGNNVFTSQELYNIILDCLHSESFTDSLSLRLESAASGGNAASFVDFYVTYTDTAGAVAQEKEVKLKELSLALNGGSMCLALGADNILLSDIDSITLRAGTYAASVEYLNVYYGASSNAAGSVTLNLYAMSFAERAAWLSRYFTTEVFVGESDEPLYLPYLENQVLNLNSQEGQTVTSQVLGGQGFAISDLSYGFYKTTSALFESYSSGAITAQDLVNDSATQLLDNLVIENPLGVFTLNNGASITLDSQEVLIYAARLSFEESSQPNAIICRRLLVPSGGLGGTEFSDYISGNTFSSYFDSLANGMLVESTEQTAFRFQTGTSSVRLIMEIDNKNDVFGGAQVNNYCAAVQDGSAYYIDINIDNIPDVNSPITVKFAFYTGAQEYTAIDDIAANVLVSTQYYSFVIPGIYRQGEHAHVISSELYTIMLEAYGAFTDSSGNRYLLVDDAKQPPLDQNGAEHPFTANLEAFKRVNPLFDENAQVDIKGVELLTGTASMVFDDVKVMSIDCFAGYSGELSSLSMNNCGITQAMLNGVASQNATPLYSATSLKSLSLAGNSIVSLTDTNGNPCVYRTVTHLNLNSQMALTDISSIQALPFIEALEIEDNAICSFAPLRTLSHLKQVFLAGNSALEFSNKAPSYGHMNGAPQANAAAEIYTVTYYGTHGQLNLPVYVALMAKGIDVYVAKLVDAQALTHDIKAVIRAQGETVSYALTDNAQRANVTLALNNTSLSGTLSGGFELSQDEYHASLILNAIFLFGKYTGGIEAPSYVDYMNSGNSTKYTIQTNFLLKDGSAIQFTQSSAGNVNTLTPTNAVSGNVGIIMSVTYGGATVYALFEVTYET